MKKLVVCLSVIAALLIGISTVQAQELKSSSGSSTGKIDSDGTIRNGSGSSVGKIDSDGTVRNSSGSSIGSANGVKKTWAAVVFFFFDF